LHALPEGSEPLLQLPCRAPLLGAVTEHGSGVAVGSADSVVPDAEHVSVDEPPVMP
jgi:hypothetical protein